MAFDWVQASDRGSGRRVNEREAAIAPLRGQRAGVEPEGFDLVDDFLIGHRVIVADSVAAVSGQLLVQPDSKCRKPLTLNANDNSSQGDSNLAMTQHHRPHESVATEALPPVLTSLMKPFREFFTAPVWSHLLVLIAGMVLTPGRRTVSAALRVIGLGSAKDFARYHYVLNHARWSPRAVACKLLAMILDNFLPSGPVVIGLDDTIERRWGHKISARGIYRDPVRSSHGHFVKTSGLRWLSVMAMVPVPWTRRRWALPFLTILAPSERYDAAHGRRHKKLTDWARQAVLQVRRWLPRRKIVVVADSGFASLDLIAALRRHVTFVTRLRLDANLYEPPPPRQPGKKGRPPKTGRRLPKLCDVLADKKTRWTKLVMPYWYGDDTRCVLEIVTGTALWNHSGLPPAPIRWVLVRDPTGVRNPQAFLCTDLDIEPAVFLGWFVSRWSMETTFQESREHLGVETQRQWSDAAIARTTPALFGMFSLMTLWAADPKITPNLRPRATAWYHKNEPTFSDVIAAVRKQFWAIPNLSMSRTDPDSVEIPLELWNRLTETLAFAA